MAQVRMDLTVADEQLLHFNDDTDDARLRSLVSETPLAEVEHREADRHSAAMARHRADLVDLIARLEAEQDSLLDKMTARRRTSAP